VRLLDVEPDLARFLGEEERTEARSLSLPVVRVAKDEEDLGGALAGSHAFGALMIDGMLLQRIGLGEQEAMRLIGPGELVALAPPGAPTLLRQLGRRVIADTRLAVLGHDFLIAARRWPGLIAGLHFRAAEQAERVSAQLVVCQLPRVADRLLAMMWLLAESWGRVTPAGVTLPILLTHEALGALVGARRPTVSLALAELIEHGSIVRQHTGWLLLASVPEPARVPTPVEPPTLLDPNDSPWTSPPPPPPPPWEQVGAELLETVHRLREEVGQAQAQMGSRLAQFRNNRERVRLDRARRARESVTRRRAPSSG
jgi:hypothetical protein